MLQEEKGAYQELLAQAQVVSKGGYRKLPAPKLLEQSFLKRNEQTRIQHNRKGIFIGLFILALYGVADMLAMGDNASVAMVVRYGIIVPGTLLATFYFARARFSALIDPLIALSTILICSLIFYIKYATHQLGLEVYSTDFVIVVIFTNIAVFPSFKSAFVLSFAVFLMGLSFHYYIGVGWIQQLYTAFDTLAIIVMSLIANYYIHLQLRKNHARYILLTHAHQVEVLAKNELDVIASLDPLTGLSNRRVLSDIASEWSMQKLGVIFADIDYFKLYNDRYGHAQGDECLKLVASIIQQTVRDDDLCIRYGGEEFLILMRNTNHTIVQEVAERLRVAISSLEIENQDSPYKSVTMSLGWYYSREVESISDIIAHADSALYQAKESGRNRIQEYLS